MTAWRLFTLEDKMEAAEEKAAQTDGDAAKRANMQQPALPKPDPPRESLQPCMRSGRDRGFSRADEKKRERERERATLRRRDGEEAEARQPPSTHLPGFYLGKNLGSEEPGAKPKYLNSKSELELVN